MSEYKKNVNERLKQTVFEKKLANGLTVTVAPIANKRSAYALLGAKIGSTTGSFTLGGKRVEVPAGIAHFLEHKLFESEQGDAFELFAKTGASANAYTSFERTCYLFSSSINIPSSLRTLIRFVSDPHFTEATVAKEQGIIGQEIKMYDDAADWEIMIMTLRNLYRVNPIREDIAGTVESIARITPELLYNCYNAFYRPANMVLSIAGDVDPDEVFAICEEEYANIAAPSEKVERERYDEPREINESFSQKCMDVALPQFCLAYKELPSAPDKRIFISSAIKLILSSVVGETTPFYRAMYDEGLLNEAFDASAVEGDDFLCIGFSGESKDPQRVAREIRAALANAKQNGLDAQLFEESRRAMLGSELCVFDSPEAAATRMLVSQFKQHDIYAIMDTIESITLSDAERLLSELFDERYSTLAVINPRQEEK